MNDPTRLIASARMVRSSFVARAADLRKRRWAWYSRGGGKRAYLAEFMEEWFCEGFEIPRPYMARYIS
jgi:hypothetical protein